MRLLVTTLCAVALQLAHGSIPYPADSVVLPEDGYLYEAEKVAPRVYTIQSPEPFHYQPLGNVTAIEQRDGFVLVDAGGSQPSAERIIAFLRQIDVNKPVKAIIITHWHGDHVLGLKRLLAEWPNARTISTEATRRSLMSDATLSYVPTADREKTAQMLAEMHKGADHFAKRSADPSLSDDMRTGFARAARVMRQHANDLAREGTVRIPTSESFADRLEIDDREAPVQAMFLGRANTDGDAVIWLPRQRVLITGDIVVAPMPYGFSSYPEDWIAVLKTLKTFDFEVLIPGHGRPMHEATYLDRLAALIADVRAQVMPVAAQGLSLEDVRKRVDFSAQRRIFAGTDRWRQTIFDYYWVDPIVRCAYREAKGEPILQGDSPD